MKLHLEAGSRYFDKWTVETSALGRLERVATFGGSYFIKIEDTAVLVNGPLEVYSVGNDVFGAYYTNRCAR